MELWKNRWFSHNPQRQQKTKRGRSCWRSKQKKSSKFFCPRSTNMAAMMSSEDHLFRNTVPKKKLGGRGQVGLNHQKNATDFHVTSSISSLDFPMMLSRINWTGFSGIISLFRGFVVTTMKGSWS